MFDDARFCFRDGFIFDFAREASSGEEKNRTYTFKSFGKLLVQEFIWRFCKLRVEKTWELRFNFIEERPESSFNFHS